MNLNSYNTPIVVDLIDENDDSDEGDDQNCKSVDLSHQESMVPTLLGDLGKSRSVNNNGDVASNIKYSSSNSDIHPELKHKAPYAVPRGALNVHGSSPKRLVDHIECEEKIEPKQCVSGDAYRPQDPEISIISNQSPIRSSFVDSFHEEQEKRRFRHGTMDQQVERRGIAENDECVFQGNIQGESETYVENDVTMKNKSEGLDNSHQGVHVDACGIEKASSEQVESGKQESETVENDEDAMFHIYLYKWTHRAELEQYEKDHVSMIYRRKPHATPRRVLRNIEKVRFLCEDVREDVSSMTSGATSLTPAPKWQQVCLTSSMIPTKQDLVGYIIECMGLYVGHKRDVVIRCRQDELVEVGSDQMSQTGTELMSASDIPQVFTRYEYAPIYNEIKYDSDLSLLHDGCVVEVECVEVSSVECVLCEFHASNVERVASTGRFRCHLSNVGYVTLCLVPLQCITWA